MTSPVRPWHRVRPTVSRDVVVLGVVAFFVALGFGVLVPVLPVFARSFGVDNLAIGAVVSAFALLRLTTSPVVGPLMGRLGERTVMSAGIFIVAVSSALAGLSGTYPQLLLLRGVGGFGSAMFTVAAMTLLLKAAAPEHRSRSVGFYQGGFLLGGMAGPAVGAVFAAISLTAPFFFYAGTLLVAGIVGLALLSAPDRGTAVAQAGPPPVPLRRALADVRYQSACLANLAQGWSGFGVRATLVPVLVVEVLHASQSWTGILFAGAAVVQTVALAPVGRYSDTRGRRPVLIAGALLAAVTIAAVPFAPNLTLLAVLLAGFGLASAALGTAPAASVGDALHGASGTPVAVFSMSSDVGAIAGPLVAGALADRAGFGAAFSVGAALLVLAALRAVQMPAGAARPDVDLQAEPELLAETVPEQPHGPG